MARRWTWREFLSARDWVRRQCNRPTGLFGVLVEYLVSLRGDVLRSNSSKPHLIKDQHCRIQFTFRAEGEDIDEQSEEAPHATNHDDPHIKRLLAGPPVVTKETAIDVQKQEARIRRYGLKKAVEMAREERRREKERQERQRNAGQEGW